MSNVVYSSSEPSSSSSKMTIRLRDLVASSSDSSTCARKWGRAEIVQLDRWWLAGIEIVQGSLGFRLGLDVIIIREVDQWWLLGWLLDDPLLDRS